MTHPSARTRRRPRDARPSPKRYRLTPTGRAWLEQHAPAGALVATCIHCGCTDARACPGGCSWLFVNRDLRLGICTNCTDQVLAKPRPDDELATKNRRALAQLRTLNNALIVAGLRAPPGAGNK
jgi:DNA-binding PadR family transcriptional regulator